MLAKDCIPSVRVMFAPDRVIHFVRRVAKANSLDEHRVFKLGLYFEKLDVVFFAKKCWRVEDGAK